MYELMFIQRTLVKKEIRKRVFITVNLHRKNRFESIG
jgi:hypothetical protein